MPTVSELVRGPLTAAYVRDRASYGLGSQFSLLRDVSTMLHSGEDVGDARGRLSAFRAEALAAPVSFAVSTVNAAQIR